MELASGNGWKLVEDEGKTILILQSIYGQVEIKSRGPIDEQTMLRDVLRIYNDLKAQGPIEVSHV